MASVPGLLEGIRVVEAAVLFNGDYVGMLLGDLGADVIKVESPGRGDYLRDFLGQITPHHSPAHVQVNRNKRSITLDLRAAAGLEVFWDLLRTADVFVDGYAADACDQLGIGYEAQRRVKPDIVYCQYTGFGAHGPYAPIPTHGQMMNALAGGVPMAMGDDGLVRRIDVNEPMGGTASGGEGTAAGGIHAVSYVLAALLRRERTGEGCYVDAAGADGVIASGWIGAVYCLNQDRITERTGLRPPGQANTSAKYQYYETADAKFILFCCIEPKFWRNFCHAVARPDLLTHQDDRAPVDFAHGSEDLRRTLQSVFHSRTQAEWVELAAAHDFPLGPAHRVGDIVDDPHLRSRQILLDADHPGAGPFTYVGRPAIVDGEEFRVERPAPALGEHTDEVLAELGYDADRVRELRVRGVV